MTTKAARGLRLRLDGMSGHEIPAMHEVSLHCFGPPTLDTQVLRRIVAALAISLGVTRLAERLLLHRARSVVLHEVSFMTQERLWQHAPNVCERVTWRTRSPLPLLFVLMTRETRTHRRQTWPARFHDSRVARDALPKSALQRQVPVMVERNDTVGVLGGRGTEASAVTSMTARASAEWR
jgi:hypothetical protein